MSKLMELVEEYGDQCFVHGRDEIPQNRMLAAGRERALLEVIRAAVAELERDAARYRALRDCGSYTASRWGAPWGLGGTYKQDSAAELDKAIDAAMEAAK